MHRFFSLSGPLLVWVSCGVAACDSDNDLVSTPDCTFVSDLVICESKVDYYEADESCGDEGGTLIDIMLPGSDTEGDLIQLREATVAGELVLDGESWWAAWPPESDCPLMSGGGASSPHDCEEAHSYICEIEA